MLLLTERYAHQIAGVLSCLDRMILTGTLPGVCYPEGMASTLRAQGIRLFDFPQWANRLRETLRENAEQIAQAHGLQIEFIRSTKAFRKEDRIRAILKERGEHPGLVHIFSAREPCPSFQPWHHKPTGQTTLRYKDSKCLHYYFYFIDEAFGLCYLRVSTWAPFRLQFYCNGHHWLARQLRQRGISFRQMDNAFVAITDWQQAQALADAFPVEALHQALDAWALRYCPVIAEFQAAYHWSLMQVEYATDIVFKRQEDLQPLYEALVHTAIHAVKPENVATFLGRTLHPNSQDEIGNDFHTRIQGTRIKHRMGPVAIKLYDKQARILRIETTTNDVSFFKHYRKGEHRKGPSDRKGAPLPKTIYSLPPLRELLMAANRRYLAFLSTLADPTPGIQQLDTLTQPVHQNQRPYRGFNPFDPEDLALFRALAQGEWAISGFQNATLRHYLPDKTGPQVSRLLKRLRLHGLIKKVGHTYKYYSTRMGQEVILTVLKLRELVLIPSLAQVMPA